MDVFYRTFLPAAAEAGVPLPAVSRHLPIVRRCVDADDTTVLVNRCAGDVLLVLTRRRLVVTRESRFLRRLRLHLNADLRHLSNVTWTPDLLERVFRSRTGAPATAGTHAEQRAMDRMPRFSPATV